MLFCLYIGQRSFLNLIKSDLKLFNSIFAYEIDPSPSYTRINQFFYEKYYERKIATKSLNYIILFQYDHVFSV